MTSCPDRFGDWPHPPRPQRRVEGWTVHAVRWTRDGNRWRVDYVESPEDAEHRLWVRDVGARQLEPGRWQLCLTGDTVDYVLECRAVKAGFTRGGLSSLKAARRPLPDYPTWVPGDDPGDPFEEEDDGAAG